MTDQAIIDLMPIARSMAYRFYRQRARRVDFDDLVGESYLALVDASSRYRRHLGSLEHYSRTKIKFALRDSHRSEDIMTRSARRCAGNTQSVVIQFDEDRDDEECEGLLLTSVPSREISPEVAMMAGELNSKRVVVVEKVAEGLSNAEIAAYLGCSVQRVKNMLRDIFDMTGVSNRTELAVRHLNNPELAAKCLSRRKAERMRKSKLPDRIARMEAKLAELKAHSIVR